VPKTWVELNQAAKIEDLRQDMERVFQILNRLGGTDQRLFEMINSMKSNLEEVAKVRPGTKSKSELISASSPRQSA
jgi:hypothetical protein